MTRPGDRDRVITAAGIIGILIVGWFAYAPGLGGAFTFDDLPNLQQLQNVDDRVSAIRFVFTGKAGPLGRPLALASFLPQAGSLDEGAGAFLLINVLLHLLNGALVVVCLRMLALAHGMAVADAGRVGILAGAIWLLMPVLASASLVVIQRMTTLSATFALLGLIGYLVSRIRIHEHPRGALVGMSLSLLVGSVLSVLCKENGALLPTLVLVMEATLLPRPTAAARAFRSWFAIMLVAPTVLIGAYLLYRGFYSDELLLMRGFSGGERVLTEARILWEYLFRAFAPLPGVVLPYNDGHAVARSLIDPLTLGALIGWIALLAFAVRFRRRFALAAFAILWFLAGHLLESTTLPLELVFDHRNYLPLIGPAFALACLPFTLVREYRPLAFASLAIYALLLAVSLHGATSRMGQPGQNSAYWYEHAPASVRAATSYATLQIGSGDIDGALATLHGFVGDNPQHAYLLIQDLNMACLFDAQGDHSERVATLISTLPDVGFSLTAGLMLSELLTTVRRVECNGVAAGTVAALAAAIGQNPRYAGNTLYSAFHHELMANIYRQQGDIDAALAELDRATAIRPSMDTTTMIVSAHLANEDYAAARQAIATARDRAPWRPVHRYLWQHDLDELNRFVDSVEAESGASR